MTKARARQAVAVRRVERRHAAVARAQASLAHHCQAVAAAEAAQTALLRYRDQLVAENAANGAPSAAVFRLDGGFGSDANLTWLFEQGDEVYTKAQNAQVTAGLLATKPAAAPWERVGQNAEVWVQTGVRVSNRPYPLDAAVERFHTGDTVRHGTLMHHGRASISADVAGWFQRYNERQTIEAAIKENQGVFQMRHLKPRSGASLALTEAFALFAANFVRWDAIWLAGTHAALPAPFGLAERPINVKQLVRTAANTSPWIIAQPQHGIVVTFTDRSPLAGVELAIGCESGFQPPLPLLKSVQIPPPKTIWSMVAQ